MKNVKTLAIFLMITAVITLCACGSSTGTVQNSTAPQESSQMQERPAGMDSVLPGVNQGEASRAKATPQPAEESPEVMEDEQYLIAVAMIGVDVSELYDAIGEPLSSDYSSSCLGSGMDGELKYEGFTVYTYLEDESEIIQDVIK